MNWWQKFITWLAHKAGVVITEAGVPQPQYDAAVARAADAEEKAATAQKETADLAQRFSILQDSVRGLTAERDAAQGKLAAAKTIYDQYTKAR